MKTKARFVFTLLGLALLLGLLPALFMNFVVPAQPSFPVAKPASPLRALLAQQSALDLVYRDWQKAYLAAGGDHKVFVTLGWTQGLSTEWSEARGQVDLDLIRGTVRAEVQGLGGAPADLWLVDNQDGPGRTIQPERWR